MGKKLPPKKLSVQITSRRPSNGLVNPALGPSPGPKRRDSSDLYASYGLNVDFGFSRALHDLEPADVIEDEDELGVYKVQPTDRKYKEPPIVEEGEPSEEPPKKDEVEEGLSKPNRGSERRWAYKNVIGISLSMFFVFTAFLGLQNLQSSINSSGGLGLGSLAILYVFFMLSGFVAPGFLKIMGTKYSILAAYVCHFLYTLANFYPSWFTLAPASLLLGGVSGLLWAAVSSHLVQVAIRVSPKLKRDQDHLISSFTGILFCFFQIAQIPGNLASSLILFPYQQANRTSPDEFDLDQTETAVYADSSVDNETETNTDIGACRHSASGHDFDVRFLYILDSVYLLFVLCGILTLITLVNHLNSSTKDRSSSRCKKYTGYFKSSLKELFGIMKSYNMVLIAPVSVFNGLEQSFAFGIFTEAFIADCFGTYQVGFTLISLGITSSIMSVVYGKIVKYVPRVFVFLFAGALNLMLSIFLLFWTPVPSYLVIFMFAVLWGAADGVWNTMTASLTGILFSTQSDSAYSAQRIYLAVGFTIGFVTAEFLPVRGSLWLIITTAVLALASIVAIEVKMYCKSCYRHHNCSTVNPDIYAVSAGADSAGPSLVKGLPSVDNSKDSEATHL